MEPSFLFFFFFQNSTIFSTNASLSSVPLEERAIFSSRNEDKEDQWTR